MAPEGRDRNPLTDPTEDEKEVAEFMVEIPKLPPPPKERDMDPAAPPKYIGVQKSGLAKFKAQVSVSDSNKKITKYLGTFDMAEAAARAFDRAAIDIRGSKAKTNFFYGDDPPPPPPPLRLVQGRLGKVMKREEETESDLVLFS